MGEMPFLNCPGIRFQKILNRFYRVRTGSITRIFQNNINVIGSPRVSNDCVKEWYGVVVPPFIMDQVSSIQDSNIDLNGTWYIGVPFPTK